MPTGPSAISTRCPSPAGTRCSTRAGSRTSAAFTATTCSWPSPAPPPAAWTRCWSPTGTIKEAQELAARCFGAQRTFFVTNGTSTANKIVHMALLRPGDVVLIDRNCHKSHHYGLALAGARPVYLDAYPLQPFAIYGGVPLRTLKQALLDDAPGGSARSGPPGGAHQRHLRRHRLPAGARDGGAAGHPPRPLLPVGRGLVRLRALPAADAAAHRHGRGRRRWAKGWRPRAYRDEYRAFRAALGPLGIDGLSDAADPRPPPAARSRSGEAARVRHPVHAQVAVGVPSGLDDSRVGRPVRAPGGRAVHRGLPRPHQHLAQPPAGGLAGRGPQADGAGGLRAW